MSRRVTVPDEHVALLLSNQLADEVSSLMMIERNRQLAIYRKRRGNAETADIAGRAKLQADICGDVLLALLEANEA